MRRPKFVDQIKSSQRKAWWSFMKFFHRLSSRCFQCQLAVARWSQHGKFPNDRWDRFWSEMHNSDRSRCGCMVSTLSRPRRRNRACTSRRWRSTCGALQGTGDEVGRSEDDTFISLNLNNWKFIKLTLSCGFSLPTSLKTLKVLFGGYRNGSAPKLNRHCWKLIKLAAGYNAALNAANRR